MNSIQFGRLYDYTVSGAVYAQPPYVSGVTIPGKGKHNVVYVATMNDVVSAFDADTGADAALWTRDLTDAAPSAAPIP